MIPLQSFLTFSAKKTPYLHSYNGSVIEDIKRTLHDETVTLFEHMFTECDDLQMKVTSNFLGSYFT